MEGHFESWLYYGGRMNGKSKFLMVYIVVAVSVSFMLAVPLSQFTSADTNPFIIYGRVTYNGRGVAGIEIDAINERTGGRILETSGDDGSYTVTFGGPVYTWEVGDSILLKAKGTGNNECLGGEKEITISSGEPIRVDIPLHLSINAAFAFSPENPSVGENISFSDLSTGKITNYTWNFGDGNISYGANPIHSYKSGGNYTVTLRVYCHSLSDIASTNVSVKSLENSTDNTNGTNPTDEKSNTPGFIYASAVTSFGIALIMFKRRKHI